MISSDLHTLILRQGLVCPSDIFSTTSTGLFLFHKVYFLAVPHPLFLPCKFCYSHMFCSNMFVKLYHNPPFIPLWLCIIYILLLDFVTKCYTMSLVNWFQCAYLCFQGKQILFISCLVYFEFMAATSLYTGYTTISWNPEWAHYPIEAIRLLNLLT